MNLLTRIFLKLLDQVIRNTSRRTAIFMSLARLEPARLEPAAADTDDGHQTDQITIAELKVIRDRLAKLEDDVQTTKTSLRSDSMLWVPDQLSNLATNI